MDNNASAPIQWRAFKHIAIGVHRNPIEVMVELGDIAAFAYAHRAVSRRMGENCVGINAAVTATHRVADFNVAIRSTSGCAGREHHRAAGDSLDSDLRACAAVFRRVNRDGIGQLGRALRGFFPIPAAAHRLDAVINERRHVAVALVDRRLDDAVVERPGAAIVGNCHGGIGGGFGDNRQTIGGSQPWHGQGHGNDGKCEKFEQAG